MGWVFVDEDKSEADALSSAAQAAAATSAAQQVDYGTDRAKFTAHDVDKDTGADGHGAYAD